VLGVPRDAPQSQIRKRYRELCLRYHPDKNTSPESRKRRDEYLEAFKRVQRANSLVGTEERRNEYDASSSRLFKGTPSSSSSSFFNGAADVDENDVDDIFLRTYQRYSSSSYFSPGGVRFYFGSSNSYRPWTNGVGVGGGGGGLQEAFGLSSRLKSTFVRRVPVSLKTLYEGTVRSESSCGGGSRSNSLELHWDDCSSNNNSLVRLWQRAAASFRGGIGYVLLYQSLLYALPLLRLVGRLGAALFAGFVFARQLPDLPALKARSTTKYRATILPGYKGGTKFTFRADRDVDVAFVLVERENEITANGTNGERKYVYRRVGNDLHVRGATVTYEQAREGCVLEIPRIDAADGEANPKTAITVEVPAGELLDRLQRRVRGREALLTVKGQGWPIRDGATKKTATVDQMNKGDLIVHVKLVRRRSRVDAAAVSSQKSRKRRNVTQTKKRRWKKKVQKIPRTRRTATE